MADEYVRTFEDSVSISGAALSAMMMAVLEKKCSFRFKAPGFSMTPFIRDNDIVTVEHISRPLRTGDVVAFKNQRTEKLTVHRVVKLTDHGYLIKGDNCLEVDGIAPATTIIGRVAMVEHSGKNIRIGLGAERPLIAFLSRHGWLTPLVRILWWLSQAGRFLFRLPKEPS